MLPMTHHATMSLKATLEALLFRTQHESAIREAQIRDALAVLAASEEAAQAGKAAAEEAEIAQALASVAQAISDDDHDYEWRALVESLAVSYLPQPLPKPL